LIPQQGGARRIKTMVIRVNRLKKKKKGIIFYPVDDDEIYTYTR
jgi:hypothetical protein